MGDGARALGQSCIVFVCCWWIPLIFFLGASNVSDSCENELYDEWLIAQGIAGWLLLVVGPCLGMIFRYRQKAFCFELTLCLQIIVGCALLVLTVWGWIMWTSLTETGTCVKTGGGPRVDPQRLAFVLLVLGTVCAPCTLCINMAFLFDPRRAL